MITLNGEQREILEASTVADLLRHLGVKPEQVAVELNRELVPRSRHAATTIASGDVLEVVTLVGGGAPTTTTLTAGEVEPLTIGTHTIRSRLLVGTGNYATLDL